MVWEKSETLKRKIRRTNTPVERRKNWKTSVRTTERKPPKLEYNRTIAVPIARLNTYSVPRNFFKNNPRATIWDAVSIIIYQRISNADTFLTSLPYLISTRSGREIIGSFLTGFEKKIPRIKTVKIVGIPITQNELIPFSKASSTETRVEVAPNQDAERVRVTRKAERFRDARKKSSILFIFREKRNARVSNPAR